MSSACVATLIDRWRRSRFRFWPLRVSYPYLLITVVFFYTTAANIYEKPDGLRIATARCKTNVEAARIDYDQFKQLYFQNPEFGFRLLHLIVGRLQETPGVPAAGTLCAVKTRAVSLLRSASARRSAASSLSAACTRSTIGSMKPG